MKRTLLFVLLAGCSPYKVLKQAAPNPLVGQSRMALLPFDWEPLMVDGQTAANWDHGNQPDEQREWAEDKQNAEQAFLRILSDASAGRVQLLPSPALAPQGFSVKCSARKLMVGGFRNTEFTVDLQVFDSTGFVVEEATTLQKGKVGRPFPIRLVEAASLAGDALGQFLLDRVGG